jgi:hypothetical protein
LYHVSSVKLNNKTKECYRDLAVIIRENNKTISAFLNSVLILIPSSKIVDCDHWSNEIRINSTHIINSVGNKNSIVQKPGSTLTYC